MALEGKVTSSPNLADRKTTRAITHVVFGWRMRWTWTNIHRFTEGSGDLRENNRYILRYIKDASVSHGTSGHPEQDAQSITGH